MIVVSASQWILVASWILCCISSRCQQKVAAADKHCFLPMMEKGVKFGGLRMLLDPKSSVHQAPKTVNPNEAVDVVRSDRQKMNKSLYWSVEWVTCRWLMTWGVCGTEWLDILDMRTGHGQERLHWLVNCQVMSIYELSENWRSCALRSCYINACISVKQ